MSQLFWAWIVLLCSANPDGQTEEPRYYSVEEAKQDIDQAIDLLTDIHPTFSRTGADEKLRVVRDTLSVPVTGIELFRLIQPMIAVDGHTTLLFNGDVYPRMDTPFFPFETVIYDDGLYIKRNLSDDSTITPGCRVEAIDGVSATEIISTLLGYVPGERRAYKTSRLGGGGFAAWYRLAYGNQARFDVALEQGGEHLECAVQSVAWEAFAQDDDFRLELRLLGDAVAYLRVGKFRRPPEFMAFMDSTFAVLKEKQVQTLVIDKTRGGGFGDLADSLLSYLTDKPYRQFESKRIKISTASRDYIEEIREEGRVDGDYFLLEPPLRSPVERKNRFSGRTFIITGPTAYSAAALFVAMAHCYSNAVVVGEEAGQPLISNGDLSAHALENSGLKLYISHSIYQMPCAANDHEGVKPEHEITLTLDDLINDRDRYLEATLELIEAAKQ